MKAKIMNKALAWLMTVSMLLSLMPGMAFATEVDGVAQIGTQGYETLQAAIDAAVDEDTITLLADVTEDVTITQKEGLDLTIDGQNKTFTGVMTVFGNGRQSGAETLTIRNVVFQTVENATSCIVSPDRTVNNAYSYSHNVTVEGCTFKGSVATPQTAAAIRHQDGGDKNWTVTDCTVDENMHSLLQVNNVAGKLTITDCEVYSKNGVNLNSCTNVEITGCAFDVQGYAVRAGVKTGGNLGEAKSIVLNNNTLKSACDDGDAVIMLRASAVDVSISMAENVVSGTTHISGTTEATTVSADANYWDGQAAPVVEGSGVVEVATYYADEALADLRTPSAAPSGTVTPAYTRADGFWGEGTSTSVESFVVELYEGEAKIASASLNDIDGIIDGDVYVTWSIPFAGSADEYWAVEWAEGYPKYDMAPDAVKLLADGVQVAANEVQFNAPDDLNKIVALAEGFTGGVVAYTTLTEAIGSFNGRQVNVLRDVTESISKMNGCTLTTNVEGGVTITNTYDDWIYCNDLNIGKGVTVKGANVFYETDGVNTIEGTLEVAETFYHAYDAKTTVQNGGSVKVGNTTILRYNENADSGLYIYGDGDDATVEFDCDYYIGAYSGTFYAEDATVECGYFLLKNSYDNSSYADISMTLDNSTLTVAGTGDGQDSFIIDDQAALTLKNGSSIADVREFNVLAGTELALSVDATSSISATNVSIAEDVPLVYEKNEDGTVSFSSAFQAYIGQTGYATLDEAFTAAQDGDEVKVVSAGTYALNTSGKDITITGAVDGVVFDNIGAKNMGGADVTFNNVTFDYYPNVNYTGLQHSGNLTYNKCTINGQVFLYGQSETFNVCTFNQNSSDAYNVWTYGAAEVAFNKCTFNSAGKSVLIYKEGDNASFTSSVSVTESTFTATQTVDGKAAIEMDSSLIAGITLTVDGATTATGFSTNTVSGSDLWNNKKGSEGDNNDITVTVDGEVVLKPVVLGLSGEGTEEEPFLITCLEDLIWFRDKVDEQASDGSTQFAGKYFKLTADIDLAGINWNPIGSMSGDHGTFKGVFDGDGHTISNLNCQQAGTGLGLFARTAGNAEIKNLTLNNVTVKSTDNSNYVGAVVANSFASTKITNVHVTGAIDISGRGYIGGISGHGYVVMDNVSVKGEGTISSTFWCAGGILGYGGEGTTNITNASVEGTGETGLTITSAAGGLGAIVGMAEDNNGTQPISGADLTAKNVKIATHVGAYGTAYANYALGYLYGGNPTSQLTGELVVENVSITTSNGETPEVNDAVADVNGAIYFDLRTAVNAAQDGDTVTLLRDVELDAVLTVSKSITINGNGKTVTQAADCSNEIALLYFEGSDSAYLDVTVKNLTFDGVKTGAAIRTLYTNVTIDGCVFQNCAHTVGQGLVRLTYGDAVIKNSKFLNNNCSMGVSFNWDAEAAKTTDDTITVDTCEFSGNTANQTALVYYVKGVGCEIKNSEFVDNKVNCNQNGAVIYLGFQENCSVTGCLFKDNTVKDASSSTRVAGALFFGYDAEISGNAFVNNSAENANGDALGQHVCTSVYYGNVDLSGNYFDGELPTVGEHYYVQHTTSDVATRGVCALDNYYTSYTTDENGNVVLADKVELSSVTYEAENGETKYTTLAEAIEAAQDGETVTLLRDVTLTGSVSIEKEITLDLGGHTITATGTTPLKVKANVTIDNGAVYYTGDDYGAICTYNDELTLTLGGNLTVTATNDTALYLWKGTAVSSAKLYATGESGVAVYTQGNRNANLTINGGEAVGTYTGIYWPCLGKLTVNGGTVSGGTGIYFKSGSVEITDGAIIGNGAKADYQYKASGWYSTGDALVVENVGGDTGYADITGKVVISGGTFTSTNAAPVASYAATSVNSEAVAVTGFISGGTFASDMTDFCADGYACVDNGDGTYGVKVALPEVVVTDIKDSLTDSDPDLTFALNFAIKDVEELTEEYLEQLFDEYGDWYTDYVLTISGLTDTEVVFNANGGADGYLAGQYDGFGPNWVSVPFEDVTVQNGESLYIMEYAAKLMGQSGLRYTLAEVATIVQNFDCGVYFTPEFLAANPDMQVELELKVFTEDAEGKIAQDISVATNDFDAADFAAAVTADGKQTQYFATLADALAAAQDGDTVCLLADAKVDGKVVVDKAITIDGNGRSIIADEAAVWYTTGSKPLYLKQYKTHLLSINSDSVTLKDIVLDCNDNAAGINVYCAQNVVFDNVSIINATKGVAGLTVNGSTLTAKTALTISGNSVAIDVSNGSGVTSALGLTIAEGTVTDLGDKVVKFAEVAAIDVTNAVTAEGAPYFASKDNAYYYTQAQMNSRTTAYSNGLTLLTDVEMTKELKVNGTLDLNGKTLSGSVATGSSLTVTGEGTVTDGFVLTDAAHTLTGREGMNVTTSLEGYEVVYANGVYSVAKAETELFKVSNKSVKVGDSLTVYYYVDVDDIDEAKDYYIQITKTYADGRDDVVKIFAESEWESYDDNGIPTYRVGFDGVAAKEMADEMKVQVFFANDNTPASEELTYCVRDYAMTMLEYYTEGELATLLVDMLNYGAAAQTQFNYNVDDLANAQLTEAQQALATQSVTAVDNCVPGPMYYTSTLNLESEIEFIIFFQGVTEDMYAEVSYTDHNGNAKTREIPFSEFDHRGGTIYAVTVDGMAVADGRQLVTCKLFNSAGEEVGSVIDSMESYIAFMSENAPSAVLGEIMKFIDSAYKYFH